MTADITMSVEVDGRLAERSDRGPTRSTALPNRRPHRRDRTASSDAGAGGGSRRAWNLAVAMSAPVLLVTVGWWWAPRSSVTVLALVPLGIAAGVDLRERRLPDVFVLASTVPVVGWMTVSIALGDSRSATGALVGAVLVGAPALVVHLVHPSWFGFGDVKASIATGAALGLVAPIVAVTAAALATAAASVEAVTRHRTSVVFGPWLLAGALAALFTAGLFGPAFGIAR